VRRPLLILCSLIPAVTVVVTELVYYYPLTPLFLDVRGNTRLPREEGERPLRLLFVGDTLLGDWARRTLEYRGYDYPFDATQALIRGADLAVGNLEGPIATVAACDQAQKTWSYRMPPRAALALRRAGFDAMSLANNHIRDCGDGGVRQSASLLRAVGVTPFGAGEDAEAAHRPALIKVGGVRIALLGYMAPHIEMEGGRRSMSDVMALPTRAGAAAGEPDQIKRDVEAARGVAELVIVSIHMGDRYQDRPTEFERWLCHGVIDAGADAVVGHGTHTMGPVEVHRGRPILYSVGNFAFGSVNLRARFSLMAFLEVHRGDRSIRAVQALPLYVNNGNPWIGFQPKVLGGLAARRALGQLLERCSQGVSLEADPPRLAWRRR
jgi:poly-gamma-glutamate capsule biosynthesis protein CapA/YwtB (metallophosphatase superfamily)